MHSPKDVYTFTFTTFIPLSATLLCLGKLVYEYHTYLNETVIDQVLEIVTALMQSKQREVLKGVLSFLKVCRIL